jgi:CheY-like chemotaxis protein
LAKLLIIEDEPFMRSMIQTVLDAAGHSTVAVASAAEGLARLSEPAPDLALIDLGLPDISGLEVLRILRATPGWRNAAIVMLTASRDSQDMVTAKTHGAQGFLSKPVTAETLVAAVNDLLAQDDLVWLDDLTRSRRTG